MIEFKNMSNTDIEFKLRYFHTFRTIRIKANGIRIINKKILKEHGDSCKYHGEKVKNSCYIKLIKEGWVKAKPIIELKYE